MTIKIYCDGADIEKMQQAARSEIVKGFTTNPTLLRKAGVVNYPAFIERAVNAFPDYPISFEVLSDDESEMEAEAHKLARFGENVYVKIPICTSSGVSCGPLIRRLSEAGIKVNVTAVMSISSILTAIDALAAAGVVSVFAGRIADTGRSPDRFITYALEHRRSPIHEILWASPRQVLDISTAESLGCDIITCTPEIIAKLSLHAKPLSEYEQETVQMFVNDAKTAGYTL